MANFGPTNGSVTNGSGSTASPAVVLPQGTPASHPANQPEPNDQVFALGVGDITVDVEYQITGLLGAIQSWIDFEITEVVTIEFQGDLEQPIHYDITAVDDIDLPIDYAIFDGSFYFDFTANNSFRWAPVVNVEVKAGDRPGESGDISEYLTGIVSVEAEENAARLADFVREPRPIGPCPTETDPEFLDLTKHIGRAVTIDYVLKDAFGVIFSTERIFTGFVNEVVFDPVTRLTSYTCSDNRQQILENMDRSSIAALMPGSYYSDFVFDPDADNLVYAEDRLSTVPYSLDLDRFGIWRYTRWAAQPTPTWAYDDSNVIYESLGITIEELRNITTKFEIDFNYDYLRLRERTSTFAWDYPGSGFCDYLNGGHTLPRKQNVVSAANGGSWRLLSVTFENMPPSDTYVCVGGVPQFWVNWGDRNAPLFCLGASGTLAKRFTNDISEIYTITLQAPEALGQYGDVVDTLSVTVEPDFDPEGWQDEGDSVKEAYIERNPQVGTTSQTAGDGVIQLSQQEVFEFDFIQVGDDRYYDCIGDEVIDGEGRRADMNNAFTTALNIGKTSLLNSHRQNTVFWGTALFPVVELYDTIEVETCPVHARGKVRSFRHEMDIANGSATSTIEIGISKTTNGAVTETPLVPPPPPVTTGNIGGSFSISLGSRYGGQKNNSLYHYASSPDPSPAINEDPYNGYTGNRSPADVGSNVYPIQFQIITDEIDEGDSDDVEATEIVNYDVNIPDELLDLQA